MTAEPAEVIGASRCRTAVVGSLAALAAFGLSNIPGISTPPADLTEILEWWAVSGTPASTMAIVRLLGIGLALLIAASAGTAALVASTDSVGATRAWGRLVPNSMQRLLATSIVIGLATSSTVVAAEELPEPVPILSDLGTAETRPTAPPTPVLTDLGPVDADPVISAPLIEPGTIDEEWTVEAGDHLWGIAHETLADRGTEPTTAEIEGYWRRLIDDNRAIIGEDADLIHPGIVLTLPA